MTVAPTDANPSLGPNLPGYDPTNHYKNVAIQVGTPVQDATTGIWYAPMVLNLSGTFSPTSPLIVELGTTAASRAAQAYAAAIQTIAVATGYCALSIYNPAASGKTLYVKVVMADESVSAYHLLYAVTTDPNYSGTNKGSVTPANLSLGGAASVANVTYSNTGAETAPPATGTLITALGQASVAQQQFLEPGSGFEIKIVAGKGIVIYVNAATNAWLAGAKWMEA